MHGAQVNCTSGCAAVCTDPPQQAWIQTPISIPSSPFCVSDWPSSSNLHLQRTYFLTPSFFNILLHQCGYLAIETVCSSETSKQSTLGVVKTQNTSILRIIRYTWLSLRLKLFQFPTNPLKLSCTMVAIFRWNGLAVAQAVRCGSLTLDTRVLFQGDPCGICGGQRDIVNRVYLSTSVFTCHYHSPALRAHISSTIHAVKRSNNASW